MKSRLALAAAMLAVAFAAAGQAPPSPRLLAPGVISTGDLEFGPALTPDGKTLYFCKGSPGNKRVMWILVSHFEKDAWATPEIAPFSGHYTDIDPTISPDGKRFFFASTRPAEAGGPPKKDFDLWMMENTTAGWSAPRRLGPEVNGPGSRTTTSVTADGTLYVAVGGQETGPNARAGRRLFRSRPVGGGYSALEPLPPPIDGGEEESNQYVSPDGRWMVFSSRRSGSEPGLYFSRSENGAWSPPVPLDARLNAEFAPYTPLVSPDGKTLYFTSVRGRFDNPPIDAMSYSGFLEAIRGPGNGLADIYTTPFSPPPPH